MQSPTATYPSHSPWRIPEIAHRAEKLLPQWGRSQHRHVTRDIRKMLDELDLGTAQFWAVYQADNGHQYECLTERGVIDGYAPTAYTHEQNGQQYPEHRLTYQPTVFMVKTDSTLNFELSS